jgi:predicted dinucleotide-binding enzyme
VLAKAWDATRVAVRSCGSLSGRIVLDATNPLLPALSGLDQADGVSGGEKVAAWAIGAKVVKVFNTTGFNNMVNPRYGEARSMMLYCGDEADAKAVAKRLAEDLGFDAVDFGPLSNARYSENLAMCWIWLALKGGVGRDFAFHLVKR